MKGLVELFNAFPHLSDQQQARFKQLYPVYEEWNAKINVISRKDFEFFYERHVLHSLGIAKLIRFLMLEQEVGFRVFHWQLCFPIPNFTWSIRSVKRSG